MFAETSLSKVWPNLWFCRKVIHMTVLCAVWQLILTLMDSPKFLLVHMDR